MRKNPKWIQDAKELGLLLIAWNVKTPEQVDWLIANEFDYITSDDPEVVLERIKKSPIANGYKLVWSDEFSYKGAPDSTKWNHEIGFKRNHEKQYYTDNLKNARVDKGHLIIESHKESIPNESFTTSSDKNWRTNQEFAQYSAASLTTKDLAEWKYGRIDIRAKLPKGVGLWPAFWMLGANYDEVKWPECGEIDIMEHVGFDPDSIFATIHTKSYNHMRNTQKGKKTFIDKPYDTFHVYSVIWSPENMEFLLDEKVYNSIENEHKSTH